MNLTYFTYHLAIWEQGGWLSECDLDPEAAEEWMLEHENDPDYRIEYDELSPTRKYTAYEGDVTMVLTVSRERVQLRERRSV